MQTLILNKDNPGSLDVAVGEEFRLKFIGPGAPTYSLDSDTATWEDENGVQVDEIEIDGSGPGVVIKITGLGKLTIKGPAVWPPPFGGVDEEQVEVGDISAREETSP